MNASHPSWNKRLARAAICIGIGIATIACTGPIAQGAETLSVVSAIVQAAQTDGSIADLLSAYENPGALQDFSQEALDLSRYRNAYAAAEGSVVTCTSAEQPAVAFSEVSAALVGGGWVAASSGSESQGTFVKSDGTYRWIYVSCSWTGESTSIVFECQREEHS